MLISEVTIPKKLTKGIKDVHGKYSYNITKHKFTKVDYLSKYLKDNGWKLIGSGSYSDCYVNPKKNYVMKINTTKDPAYEYFIDLRKTLKSRYLPRILASDFILKGKTKYYIYLIEKLQQLPKKSKIATAIDNLALHFLDPTIYDEFSSKDEAIIDKYPGLRNLISKLALLKHKKYGLDIHKENVMMRSDGTPVITDPYCP